MGYAQLRGRPACTEHDTLANVFGFSFYPSKHSLGKGVAQQHLAGYVKFVVLGEDGNKRFIRLLFISRRYWRGQSVYDRGSCQQRSCMIEAR